MKPTAVKSPENWPEVRSGGTRSPGEADTKLSLKLSSAQLSLKVLLTGLRGRRMSGKGWLGRSKGQVPWLRGQKRSLGPRGGGSLTVNASFQVGPAGLRLGRRYEPEMLPHKVESQFLINFIR